MRVPSGDFLAPKFIAFAHRGGALLPANHGIENTMTAFRNAVELGFDYLETDVHVTHDGELVAFHDTHLARVTDVEMDISDVSYDELEHVRVGADEHIPSVDELFENFPHCGFNIDIKAPGAIEPLARALQRHGMEHRVCVGSFSSKRLNRFRRLLPHVTTAVTPPGVFGLSMRMAGQDRNRAARVYQVPLSQQVGPLRLTLVTPDRVRAVHRAGRKIHVWTIDDPDVMHELIDWGVDGIFTDRPDLLKGVLLNRGMWSTATGT